jgi:integrase
LCSEARATTAGAARTSCRLRIKDVDFATNQITIRDGKGGKDRRTMLPGAVKADLAKLIERVRALHQRDLRQGAGWIGATQDSKGAHHGRHRATLHPAQRSPRYGVQDR